MVFFSGREVTLLCYCLLYYVWHYDEFIFVYESHFNLKSLRENSIPTKEKFPSQKLNQGHFFLACQNSANWVITPRISWCFRWRYRQFVEWFSRIHLGLFIEHWHVVRDRSILVSTADLEIFHTEVNKFLHWHNDWQPHFKCFVKKIC